MTIKPLFFLVIISTLAFVACKKATPAGFWKNYKKGLLVKYISDQGPYGGQRALYWKSDKANLFDKDDILVFAKENGWTFVDSADFNQEQTSKWIYDKNPIFPLSHLGLGDTAKSISTSANFPRWFSGYITVYIFKTGWIAIEPGTDNSLDENGFVVLNSDRTEMAVYHLWGE